MLSLMFLSQWMTKYWWHLTKGRRLGFLIWSCVLFGFYSFITCFLFVLACMKVLSLILWRVFLVMAEEYSWFCP